MVDFDSFTRTDAWRLVIKAMGANRGPGTTLVTLNDPKAIGASVMHNSGGELHFTLPVDHPAILTVLPKLTHYSLQILIGDTYVEKFAGLIDDMHATDTDVIFYGIDYLGLFAKVIDDRFDPDNVDKSSADGGSKYIDETIAAVVTDQLDRAVAMADSPVGFISVGAIATTDEHVTVWSTMQATLPFIVGLIDSHRQGSGIRTRISVSRVSENVYSVGIVDNPGTDRPELELEYGERVQGYQVIPFGEGWGTVIDAIGRTQTGLKILYESEDAPGIDQGVWGRFAQPAVFTDLDDENDLKRRTKQAASRAGKQGRQMGLGLRTKELLPTNGYDICDSVPVNIVHGAVDTTSWGDGYWTIWGLTWEGFDDAHAITNLVLLPREEITTPDPALAPSDPLLPPGGGYLLPWRCDPGAGPAVSGVWAVPEVGDLDTDGAQIVTSGGGSGSTLTFTMAVDGPDSKGMSFVLDTPLDEWQISYIVRFTGDDDSIPAVDGLQVCGLFIVYLGGDNSGSFVAGGGKLAGLWPVSNQPSPGVYRRRIYVPNYALYAPLLGDLHVKIRRIEIGGFVFAMQAKVWPTQNLAGVLLSAEPSAWTTSILGDAGTLSRVLLYQEKDTNSTGNLDIAVSSVAITTCGQPPVSGQWMPLEFVASSDGMTTAYTLDYPYAFNSLHVLVDRLDWTNEIIQSDPAAGTFTFTTAPHTDDTIEAWYMRP